jgi:hypothetical protein
LRVEAVVEGGEARLKEAEEGLAMRRSEEWEMA